MIQLAMSGGTMIACACKQIIMGRQSSLGPVDAQVGGGMIPAHSILQEFEQAKNDIASDSNTRFVWEPILSKYPPGFIDQCKKAIAWSKEIVTDSLARNMFKNDKEKAREIARKLTDVSTLKVHNRHLSLKHCKEEYKLNVQDVYELAGPNQEFKEANYALHYANIHTLESAPIIKIIESHEGRSIIRRAMNN